MAQKFSREFNQAVMLITEAGKALQSQSEVLHDEIMNCLIDQTEYRNIMFCIGFTKSISSVDDHLIDQIWAILTQGSKETTFKSKSMYHFLCYLQSFEIAVDIPSELLQTGKKNPLLSTKYGLLFKGVFYMD